jgi:hypothetical protein
MNRIKKYLKERIGSQLTRENIIAFVGLGLVQGALLPSHWSGNFPHITLPIFIFLGLNCYMYKAIVDRDLVYIVSNTIGLTLNGLMIIRILIGA